MLRKSRAVAILIIIMTIYWNFVCKETRTRILINPTQYRFIKDYTISPPNGYCQKNPFIIMIVTSYVGDIELRNLFRKAMPRTYLEAMNTTRIFLLANIPPHDKNITQSIIEEENDNFQDILQGSFLEDYHNLTIKHLMGLNWVAEQCPNASYLLKVDDDTVFRLERLFNTLLVNTIDDDFVMGYMLKNTEPKRVHNDKWYVSSAEYPRRLYPSYVSGWYYVTTPTVAAKLVNEAMYHPYFWIDDILVTGTLVDALDIKLYPFPDEFWFENTLNIIIHTNKGNWDIAAYNYSLAIVNLAKKINN